MNPGCLARLQTGESLLDHLFALRTNLDRPPAQSPGLVHYPREPKLGDEQGKRLLLQHRPRDCSQKDRPEYLQALLFAECSVVLDALLVGLPFQKGRRLVRTKELEGNLVCLLERSCLGHDSLYTAVGLNSQPITGIEVNVPRFAKSPKFLYIPENSSSYKAPVTSGSLGTTQYR